LKRRNKVLLGVGEDEDGVGRIVGNIP